MFAAFAPFTRIQDKIFTKLLIHHPEPVSVYDLGCAYREKPLPRDRFDITDEGRVSTHICRIREVIEGSGILIVPQRRPLGGVFGSGTYRLVHPNDTTLIVERAARFAKMAHAYIDHRRRYTNEPYINHPKTVAEMVAATPGSTPEMVAAALLHDVVEDTPFKLDTIKSMFGIEVANLVKMLTDVALPEDGNRSVRVCVNRNHLAKASPDAQTIKLADIIDNTASIMKHDPKFSKVYLPEIMELLNVLRLGNQDLWNRAWVQVNQGLDSLKA